MCKQIPFCYGYYVINNLNDLPIEMDYSKSPFGQNNVDWFLKKVRNVEFQLKEFFELNKKTYNYNQIRQIILQVNICWLSDKKYC